MDSPCLGKYSIPNMFPIIDASILDNIGCVPSSQEVHHALFEMSPLKALGVDGLHSQFYESQWNVVSESIVSMIKRVFEGDGLETYLTRLCLF